MKRIYRIYDEDTNSFIPTTYVYEHEAEAALSAIHEFLPESRVTIFIDSVPTDLYTISSRRHGTSENWDLVTDADSISEAFDLITFRLDTMEYSYDYRITKTDYPDQVILDVIPGAAYPKLEMR